MERHIASVDRAEQERDAWAAHARGLAQKLVQARKHVARLERQLAAATGQPVPQSGSHDDDAVSLANADEDARQLAKLLDIEQALAEAGQAGQNGSTASAQPAASGSFRLGSTQSVNAAAAYPASVLSAQNETRVAVAESDAAVAAVLAAGLAADAAAAVAMVPVNPTPNQQRVLEQLVQRGRSMGWLIQPSEVSAACCVLCVTAAGSCYCTMAVVAVAVAAAAGVASRSGRWLRVVMQWVQRGRNAGWRFSSL